MTEILKTYWWAQIHSFSSNRVETQLKWWVLNSLIRIWKVFPQQTIIFHFRVIFLSRNLLSQFSEIALKSTMMVCCGRTFHILIREFNTHYLSLISTWYEEIEWIWTHLRFWEFLLLQTSTVWKLAESRQTSILSKAKTCVLEYF